jgi:hypothetical protein
MLSLSLSLSLSLLITLRSICVRTRRSRRYSCGSYFCWSLLFPLWSIRATSSIPIFSLHSFSQEQNFLFTASLSPPRVVISDFILVTSCILPLLCRLPEQNWASELIFSHLDNDSDHKINNPWGLCFSFFQSNNKVFYRSIVSVQHYTHTADDGTFTQDVSLEGIDLSDLRYSFFLRSVVERRKFSDGRRKIFFVCLVLTLVLDLSRLLL